MVERYCRNPSIDKESLAINIWLEQFNAGPNRVKSRVFDALRAQRRRVHHETFGGELPRDVGTNGNETQVSLNLLARKANLSDSEQFLLYLRFWKCLGFNEIADAMHCSSDTASAKLKQILQRLYLASQSDGL